MNARFAPIVPNSPEPRAPLSMIPNFGHLAMDEVSDYAQTLRITPADTTNAVEKLYEQGDLSEYAHGELTRLEEHYARQRLMSERPAPTPNGKHFGIAMDACAALFQIVQSCRAPGNFDQFSEVDVDKWAAICARMGYRA